MIDCHQHFWTTSRSDYGWLAPDDPVLYRDFGPQDLTPLITPRGIEQTVLVQAAPTVEETLYLLDIAKRTKWVAAVVGWVGLDEPGDDYDTIIALSNADDPGAAQLLRRASGQAHTRVIAEGSPDYVTIAAWMAGGLRP